MKRSSKSRENKLPGVLFTLICFAGAAMGLWLFWRDINRVLAKQSEQAVGMLSYKHHVVQRRFEDRLMWSQIPRETPIYNGDLVRTSELSDAVITFVSDDLVSLSENSLIQVHYDEETNSFIELLSGDVSLVSVSGKIGVLSGEQKLQPGPGGAIAVRRGQGGTEARVLAGRAEISSSGETYTLEAGQSAGAGPEGTVDITETLAVSEPLPNQELQAETSPMPVTFSWTPLASNEYIRLEVARDQDFTDPVYTGDEYRTSGTVVLLPPGAWWWRMFQVEQGSPLPSSPVQDGRLTVLEPLPSARAALPPGTALVTAPPEIAALLSLPVVRSAPVNPPPVEASPAPPVAPDESSGPARSAVPALLGRPEGLFPPPETMVDGVYLKTSSRIVFNWDAVYGANAYIFTISRGLTVKLHLVREPRFVFTDLASLDNGRWTWQVEAVSLDSDGGIRRHGEPAGSSFSLAVPRPNVPQVDNPGIIYER
jgi:hypothetical protein